MDETTSRDQAMKPSIALALVLFLVLLGALIVFVFYRGSTGEQTRPAHAGDQTSRDPEFEEPSQLRPTSPDEQRRIRAEGDQSAIAQPGAGAESTPPLAADAVRLTGRIVDVEGVPIAGATITTSCLWTIELPMLLARSGPDGRFSEELRLPEDILENLAPRGGLLLDLEILADGHAGEVRNTEWRQGAALELGVIVLQRGTEVTGWVQNDQGDRIPDASVYWRKEKDFPQDLATATKEGVIIPFGEYFSPSVTADNLGFFRLLGVPLEPGFLVGAGLGHDCGWTEVFSPRPGEIIELNLTLPRGPPISHVRGTVLDPDGVPLDSAVVRCGLENRFWRTTADENGHFEVEFEGSSPVRLIARDSLDRWYPVEQRDVAAGSHVTLRLEDPRWIDVLITDPEGQSVPESLVRIRLRDSDLFGYEDPASNGVGGIARILRPHTTFELWVSAPGFTRAEFGPFEPAKVGDRLELTLEPAPALRGRIVHAGRPVAGARLSLAGSFERGLVGLSWDTAISDRPFAVLTGGKITGDDARTDEDGRFVVYLKPDSWHALGIVAEGFPATVWGQFQSGEVEGEVEIELERGGAIEGRVLMPAGRSPAGTIVGVSDDTNLAHTQVVDEQGAFRFDQLEPGQWQIRPCEPPVESIQSIGIIGLRHDRKVQWDCRVSAGEVTRCDLDLREAGAVVLRGRLTMDGVSTAGWKATLYEEGATGRWDDYRLGRAQLDEEGRFEFAVSEGGRFLVEIFSPSGSGCFLQAVDVRKGDNPWRVHIATGALRIDGEKPEFEDGNELRGFYYRWESPEGLLFFGYLPLDDLLDDGDVLVESLPAGSGDIVREDPDGWHGKGWLASDLAFIIGVEVPAGGEGTIKL